MFDNTIDSAQKILEKTDCQSAEKVMEFIENNQEVFLYASRHLKFKRFEHTILVMAEAVKLSDKFGANREKVLLASLLHDVAKAYSIDKMNLLIRKYDLPKKYINQPNLAHSKIAEKMAEYDLKIKDATILNGISFHTTGRAYMSVEEMIVFLADGIEPSRSYDGVKEIRNASESDLLKGCLMMLENTVTFLKKAGTEIIDSDTDDAINWLKKQCKI